MISDKYYLNLIFKCFIAYDISKVMRQIFKYETLGIILKCKTMASKIANFTKHENNVIESCREKII